MEATISSMSLGSMELLGSDMDHFVGEEEHGFAEETND